MLAQLKIVNGGAALYRSVPEGTRVSDALARAVRQAIGGLLERMCAQAGRETAEIDGLVITGNTAMLHLLTGEDPSPLAAAPFAARELFGKTVPARALDLPCGADASVYLPRCMSAFVGGDVSAALLASGICRRPDTAMLADIGTNGEIVLWHEGRLSCCSTAAGPAFEGANLSQGMQGVPGAIDRVWLEGGALAVHTIGDAPARGICGSGAADALACLLRSGQLDESGCLSGGFRRNRGPVHRPGLYGPLYCAYAVLRRGPVRTCTHRR